jgi:hypothetical protein
MPDTPIRTKVHEALDVHGNFAPQIALNFKLRNFGAEIRNFRLCEIFDFGIRSNASRLTNFLCA